MYKALKLYPLDYHCWGESVTITESVKARYAQVKRDFRHDNIMRSKILNVYGDAWEGEFWEFKVKHPELNRYFKLAELYGWDISRDVNYAYAEVLSPPEEIRRRVMRAFPITKRLPTACFLLESEIGFDVPTIKATILYKRERSEYCYCKLMRWLMKFERAKGYPDSLDFEE